MNHLSNIKNSIRNYIGKRYFPLIPNTLTIISNLSLIFIVSLLSCSDNLEVNSLGSSSNDCTITICIPDIDEAAEFGATRSDEFQNTRAISEAAEGGITSLWLFAFKDETIQNNTAITKVTPLTGHSSLNITTQNGYKQYQVNNFSPGSYHIYLVANLDSYLDKDHKITTSISESDLNDLFLNFSTENTLEKGNLPMYCLNTQIKKTANGNPVENGIFQLSENTSIYADLRFLCAKIRYTILFDHSATGFSYQFSSNNVNFDLNASEAKNLAKQTNFTKPITDPVYTASDLFDLSKITLNRVQYPSAGSMYFDIANSSVANSPANLTVTSATWGTTTSKRAWQGIVYIPENLSGSEDTQSYLKFKSSGSEMEDYYSFKPGKFERGQMYDLVAKLKKSDIDVDVMISDWKLESLYYTLHGPYQLVVEYDQIELQSGKYFPIGYKTDTNISYEIPQIYCTNANGETGYFDFYTIEPLSDGMVDEDGNPYSLSGAYDGYFRVTVNPNLPFEVIWALMEKENDSNSEDRAYTDEAGVKHTLESLSYFHVVAGNLHKKINVSLNLKPFLNVYPKIINIDTREYYLSVTDSDEIIIRFFTNYDNRKWGIDFHMIDDDLLVEGLGETDSRGNYDLQLKLGSGIDSEGGYDNEFPIVVTEGEVRVKISNMIGTHTFWKSKHEYTLTFELKVRNPITGYEYKTLTENVTIIIKPYLTNYIIHFKDATNTWAKGYAVHTFIYQDLLLPSDLSKGTNNDDQEVDATPYAGMIVGYVEEDANNKGKQAYNAATQYVFSNNISFRGWKGYGGPDLNNPYDIYEEYINNSKYSRQGFIMLGKPDDRDGTLQWVWNERYGYTNRNKITDTDGQQIRTKMYRYDVNFNEDHERSIEEGGMGWQCSTCVTRYNNGSLYNSTGGGSDHDYDYPGIVMEKETGENDGWWKYTLTGVASPGKTMIIFANSEAPWDRGDQNDHRFPGDYDTGLPLFDFEDNEGWFIFNGKNTENETNTQAHFFDEKEEALKAYKLSN
ncbi:MAG: hypothetical protein J1F67_08335 [Muribaculaceae bacterium]|nr:hypothetical protein [Muribaculaceae bacterium]